MVRTFGKYLLDEEIARGGMSRVFSARLRGLGGFEKKLVVKQVLPELASDPRFVSMFVDEAKTLVQMSHPHIAPVYELGVVDGVYFLAMEYVEGATLSAILKEGPLAPSLVAHLGVEICDALHYAHSRFSIVHRDVTPRNVIVDSTGHSRLLDFGIAANAGEGTEIFGTPGYLSPEQLEGGPLGPESDVFSLGAVLFEALTGRRAFDARTVDEAREALRERPELDGDVPTELAAIVKRALSDDRFASARDMGRALRSWLASESPEGVAPELGLRAERAEAQRERISQGEIAPTPSTERHEVRTLATSRALDAIFDADAPGTVPIEGRKSIPTPSTEVDPLPPAKPSPLPTWLALAVAGAVVAVLVYLGATYESTPPIRETPRADVAPPPPPPDPEPVIEPPVIEPAIEPPPVVEVPPPAIAPAAITVNASPWGEVLLDGRNAGRTPVRRLSVRPGRHTILVRCPPLGREVEHRFEAESDQRLTIVADLTVDPPVVRVR